MSDTSGNHSNVFLLYRSSSGTIIILDLNDTRGMAPFSIVVPYSKIGGFPQIIEKNWGVGKKL